jgi:hypothetical protein
MTNGWLNAAGLFAESVIGHESVVFKWDIFGVSIKILRREPAFLGKFMLH